MVQRHAWLGLLNVIVVVMMATALSDCNGKSGQSSTTTPTPVLMDVTFSDGAFADPEWETVVQVLGSGGGDGGASQQAAGGTPGSYRQVIATKEATSGDSGSTWVFSFKRTAVYTPSSAGAIRVMDFAVDGLQFVQGDISGGTVALALRQGSQVYWGPYGNAGILLPERSWTRKTATNLSSSDFRTPESSAAHPDFTQSGGAITVGVLYEVFTQGPFVTRTAGLDNWSVTIRH